MKQITIGEEKGYLIPIRGVDEKLRNKYKELKNKKIETLSKTYDSVAIEYKDMPKTKIKKNYRIVEAIFGYSSAMLVVSKREFMKMFGIKGSLISINIVRKKRDKISSTYWRETEFCIDKKGLYYFFEIGEDKSYKKIYEIR